MKDDWLLILLLGFLAIIIGALVYIEVTEQRARDTFTAVCQQAGGTPVHADNGSFCVAAFAVMRKGH